MRSLPFGYRMEDGEYVVNNDEKKIIKKIYNMYLEDNSLQKIADYMTNQGVRYHTTKNHWNKNMISRILQNSHYISQEKYPQIIPNDIFKIVSAKIKSKTSPTQKNNKAQYIKQLLYCKECGGKINRRTSSKGKERWYCVNDNKHISSKISDDHIMDMVKKAITEYKIKPKASDLPSDPQHITNLNREIDKLLMLKLENSDFIKDMIMKVATERYAVCENGNGEYIRQEQILKQIHANDKIKGSDLEQVFEKLLLTFNGDIIIVERR